MLDSIDRLIGIGCTIDVTCDAIDITRRTFYNWKIESQRLNDLADASPRILVTLDDVPMLRFLPIITQANARAMALAVNAVHSAILGERRVYEEPYTYTETRLRKAKNGEEIPYLYQETRFRQVENVTPPDWRAGIEFLKRRDPATWNPPTKIEVSWEDKAIADIRAGAIEFDELADAFDDYDLAADLFARAGKAAPPRTSETAERARAK